jgi:alcohol dehydrogenase class IV
MEAVQFYLPTKIIAGPGVFRTLPGLLPVQNGTTALITDTGILATEKARELVSILRDAGGSLEIYDRVVPDPDEAAAGEAADFVKNCGADQVISLGGGSSLDTAKVACALAVNDKPLSAYQWEGEKFTNPPVPLFALPTTAGTGSEVTGVSVITSRDTKKGVLGDAMYPKAALIDAELTLSLPPNLTAHTGMDAIAHAVEAYVGRSASPVSDSFAREAIRLAGRNLLRVYENGGDLEARHGMALASCMAGIAFDQSGLGIIHSLASPVCADLHIPHGLAMAFLLPHGMEFNRRVREERIAEIGVLLGAVPEAMPAAEAAEQTVQYVAELRVRLGLTEDFREITRKFDEHKISTGTNEENFGRRATEVFLMRNNPVQPTPKECAAVFTKIFAEHRV